MDKLEALRVLSSQMMYEPDGDIHCTRIRKGTQEAVVVSKAQLPNGKQIKLLKTLLSSACERNCNYCPFRAGRNMRRDTISPDDMARVFMSMYHAGIVQGLFLSSGVLNGSTTTQDKIIATAEILRNKYQYSEYLHLKIMPGAQPTQIEQAMRLANRVSINLEAPNEHRLKSLAPSKEFINELIQPIRWVQSIRREQPNHFCYTGRWPSVTTQFVVGAVGESDLEILSTTDYLHREVNLARAYFSAFNPVSETPLENNPATNPKRQHRLYQASYLLRDYGYLLEELPFEAHGDLPLDVDPKTVWANKYLTHNPVEINEANRHELLRIPGIGIKGVSAILKSRRIHKLCSPEDLFKIGIPPKRVLPYILINGRKPVQQLQFWL